MTSREILPTFQPEDGKHDPMWHGPDANPYQYTSPGLVNALLRRSIDSGLALSIALEGVKMPVVLATFVGEELQRPVIMQGHHRVSCAAYYRPDDLIPVLFDEGDWFTHELGQYWPGTNRSGVRGTAINRWSALEVAS